MVEAFAEHPFASTVLTEKRPMVFTLMVRVEAPVFQAYAAAGPASNTMGPLHNEIANGMVGLGAGGFIFTCWTIVVSKPHRLVNRIETV